MFVNETVCTISKSFKYLNKISVDLQIGLSGCLNFVYVLVYFLLGIKIILLIMFN